MDRYFLFDYYVSNIVVELFYLFFCLALMEAMQEQRMQEGRVRCWGFLEGEGLGSVGFQENVALLDVLEYVAMAWAALLVEYQE